jgi:hypothetical protein
MNATEDTIQVPGHMLIGYVHSVSKGLTVQVNVTADSGNRAALKGRVSKETRQEVSAKLNHLTEDKRRVTEPALQ